MFAIRVSWPDDSIYNVCHSSFLAKRQYLQCLPFEFLGQKTVSTMSAIRVPWPKDYLQCLPLELLGQKTVFTMSAILLLLLFIYFWLKTTTTKNSISAVCPNGDYCAKDSTVTMSAIWVPWLKNNNSISVVYAIGDSWAKDSTVTISAIWVPWPKQNKTVLVSCVPSETLGQKTAQSFGFPGHQPCLLDDITWSCKNHLLVYIYIYRERERERCSTTWPKPQTLREGSNSA